MIALHHRLWLAVCFVLLSASACGSPLVGLECRDGYERCGGACYDLASDDEHCGGCGIACGTAQQCVDSMCVAAPLEAGLPEGGEGGAGEGGVDMDAGDGSAGEGGVDIDAGDAGREGGALPEGSVPPDGALDGGGEDGGDGAVIVQPPPLCTGAGSPADCVCGLGQTPCDLTCVDTLTDRDNCGTCGNACDPVEYCNGGVCDLICTPPLELCTGLCVDYTSDDAHCGGCNMPCSAAAACINSACVGAAIGHLVVIGHDMSVVRPQIRQMVGNAVFLAPRSPVRVLSYEAGTSSASRSGIGTAIMQSAAQIGRQYTLTTAAPDTFTQQLGQADVLVIAPQQEATDLELITLGASWSSALSDFLFRGGVVLLIEGGPGAGTQNAGTYQILRSATQAVDDGMGGTTQLPLFDCAGASELSQRILNLVRPGDAIAAGVSTQYQSQGVTTGFSLPAMPNLLPHAHNVVVADTAPPTNSDLPVVVHVVFEP